MTAVAVVTDRGGDLLGDYEHFVDSISVNGAQRSQRKLAARRFIDRHPDLGTWMTRPTSTRLLDVHRLKAWPWLTWLFIDQRLRPDLELLLAKPPGVDLGVWWILANDIDVTAARVTAAGLGWSPNWTRQVLQHSAPLLCLWLDKGLVELTDGDFDAAITEARTVNVGMLAADRFGKRTSALRQICFQQGLVDLRPSTLDPRPGPRPTTPPTSPNQPSAVTSSATRSTSPQRCGPRPGRAGSRPFGCSATGLLTITPT